MPTDNPFEARSPFSGHPMSSLGDEHQLRAAAAHPSAVDDGAGRNELSLGGDEFAAQPDQRQDAVAGGARKFSIDDDEDEEDEVAEGQDDDER